MFNSIYYNQQDLCKPDGSFKNNKYLLSFLESITTNVSFYIPWLWRVKKTLYNLHKCNCKPSVIKQSKLLPIMIFKVHSCEFVMQLWSSNVFLARWLCCGKPDIREKLNMFLLLLNFFLRSSVNGMACVFRQLYMWTV